jgi:hypothetical protein
MKPRLAATGRYLMLLGAGCLIIVVLTHVCEHCQTTCKIRIRYMRPV